MSAVRRTPARRPCHSLLAPLQGPLPSQDRARRAAHAYINRLLPKGVAAEELETLRIGAGSRPARAAYFAAAPNCCSTIFTAGCTSPPVATRLPFTKMSPSLAFTRWPVPMLGLPM